MPIHERVSRDEATRRGSSPVAVAGADAILALHRAAGNAAVARLLGGAPARRSVQRLPTRRQVEDQAREVTLAWLRSPDQGKAAYAKVGPGYEGLLAALDDYHATIARTAVPTMADGGPATFAKLLADTLLPVRTACAKLGGLDTAQELKVVREGVLLQLFEEFKLAQKLEGLTDPLTMRQGWDGQFAQKSIADALRVAGLVLPLYLERGGFPERGFVQFGTLPRGLPKYGWKLHVSVDEFSLERARDVVLPVLKQAGHTHKIVADVRALTGGQAGKVITVYPTSREQAEKGDYAALIVKTEVALEGAGILPGPAIANETPVGSGRFVYKEEGQLGGS